VTTPALREIHRAIDHATFAAYGWTDLDPVHDHLDTRQGVRWTIDPTTRQEMLDRLLELNHERYAAEQGKVVGLSQQRLRLAGAVLVEIHDEWAVTSDRRYLSEASMKLITNHQPEEEQPTATSAGGDRSRRGQHGDRRLGQ